MPKMKSAMTKRNSKAPLMRAVSFVLIAPVTTLVTTLFSNWRLGAVSVAGILMLALIGIFNAELTRPMADYLRDGFLTRLPKLVSTSPILLWKGVGVPSARICWQLRKLMPACQFCRSI